MHARDGTHLPAVLVHLSELLYLNYALMQVLPLIIRYPLMEGLLCSHVPLTP